MDPSNSFRSVVVRLKRGRENVNLPEFLDERVGHNDNVLLLSCLQFRATGLSHPEQSVLQTPYHCAPFIGLCALIFPVSKELPGLAIWYWFVVTSSSFSQGEVCSMINQRYIEFLPSMQTAKDLESQVKELSDSVDSLKTRIENEVMQKKYSLPPTPPHPGQARKGYDWFIKGAA